MTSLAHFPPEILSLICSPLNGFDVGRLWLSGNRLVMVRLENLCITRFELPMTQEINSSWPKLISRFKRLESLSIRPQTILHKLWFRDIDLSCISATLKHLELESDGLEFFFFGLPFVVSDPHPDPMWSPPTEGQFNISPFPFSDRFPCLEKLILGGKMDFPSILIPMLPVGLLWLSLPYHRIEPKDIRLLPPNLTRLELPEVREMGYEQETLIFPSSLLHLDLRSLNLTIAPPLILPPTVTYLNIQTCSANGHATVSLPPSLVHLIDQSYSSEIDGATLPTSLEHLQTLYRRVSTDFEKFPRRLQTLVAYDVELPNDVSFSLLPHGLTHLQLHRVTNLPASCLASIPSTIRVLKLETNFFDVQSTYAFMDTLEELDVKLLEASALKYAPKLRSLDITHFTGHAPVSFEHLTNLTVLRIMGPTSKDQVSFPDSLTELKIENLSSPHSFRSLPRGLKLLFVFGQADMSGASVARLPPALTDLHCYDNISANSLSDLSAGLLPASLQSLRVSNVDNLTDNGIAKLPRSLRLCYLGNAPLLTDSFASGLPRQLTYFSLTGSIALSNAFIPHLPRTLVCLNIMGRTNVTDRCLPHLPPRISEYCTFLPTQWEEAISKTKAFLLSTQ